MLKFLQCSTSGAKSKLAIKFISIIKDYIEVRDTAHFRKSVPFPLARRPHLHIFQFSEAN